MNKLIIAFCCLAFFFAIINGMYIGTSNYSSTRLTAAIAEDDTDFTMHVRNTSGFNDAGYVVIGGETLQYNGRTATTFLNVEHAAKDSSPYSHEAGSVVYTERTDALNASLGFSVADTGSGLPGIMMFGYNFATHTIPQLVTFDYEFLHDGPMEYLYSFLICLSAGFVFVVIIMVAQALGGVLQAVFVK